MQGQSRSYNVVLYLYTDVSPSQLIYATVPHMPRADCLVTCILVTEVRVWLECLPPSTLVQVFLVVRDRRGMRVGRSIMLTHLLT